MIDVETYLLNTLFSWPEEVPDVVTALKPEDFTRGQHGVIFAELAAMASRGTLIDIATLADSLKASGNLGRAGGVEFLMELGQHLSAGAALIPEHVRIIREASMRRAMRLSLQQALAALEDPTRPLVEVAGLAEAAALAGVSRAQGRDLRPVKDYMSEVFAIIERQSKKEITGLKTGFFDIDQHTSGFQRSDLIILGGRPRMGKTAWATDIAANVAIDQKKSVAFFELEMSGRQIVERHLLARAKVNGQLLRSGKLPERDYPRISLAVGPINASPWFIDDTVGLTPLAMLSKCRRHRMKHGLDLVVVDNIQKMRGDGKYGSNKRLEIADITNSLKNMAKDLDVPILAISHLSRGPDMRADPEPVLSDLQESGNIEQDADIVILLYREEVYKDVEPEKKGETKVIFAKYRNGEEGHKLLRFNDQFSSFENWGGDRTEAQIDYKNKQVGDTW